MTAVRARNVLAVALLCSMSLGVARAAPTAVAKDLGTLGGMWGEAVGVNDSGQVVGYSWIPDIMPGVHTNHAFLWTTAAGMVDLGTLGGTESRALAVSNTGQVVGYSFIANDSAVHAFSWTASGGMVDLGTLGGNWSQAVAVSDAGQVVGWSYTAGNAETHAFSWTPSDGMVDLGTIGGGTWSEAVAVNNVGQVAGFSYTAGNQARRAFSWTAGGGMIDLGTLSGGTWAAAGAVNDAGQVVGTGDSATSGVRSFIWTESTGMADLGSLGGGQTLASAVNGNGQVVGHGYTAAGAIPHAFSWTASGGIIDLGTLGGTNSYAIAVNESGQVAGESDTVGNGELHGFSWAPTGGMVDLGTLGGTQSVVRGINNRGQVVGFSYTTGNSEMHPVLWDPAWELGYDDGSWEVGWGIGQPFKVGVMFSNVDVPYCKSLVRAVRLYSVATSGTSPQLKMFFLNPRFEEVRAPIYTPVLHAGWNEVDVTALGLEIGEDLLVAVQWIKPDGSWPQVWLGYDSSSPANLSHSYEYNLAKWGGTGWHSPADPSDGEDPLGLFMIRAVVQKAGPCLLSVKKAGGGVGTVTSSPSGINCGTACDSEFDRGASVTLTATSAPGSSFMGWDACPGLGTCQVTTDFVRSVTATFAPGFYDITATATGPTGSGTIAPAGKKTVPAGGTETYTITANPGYRINYVAVDGVSVGAVGSYTFTNVQANHAIKADFVPVTYAITVSAGPNGAISPSTYSGFKAGANQTYTITPSTGYHVADVVVDGGSVGVPTSYPFLNIQANHTISATFEANPSYTITATAGPNGSITPLGDTTVAGGASQKYTIAPSAGYRIEKVLVDGVSKGAIASYTFTSVNANHTISASFVKDEYTITASVAGGSGTISPVGSTTVGAGGGQTYTITPAAGYKVNYVAVNGAAVSFAWDGTKASYTFSNVRQNYTIKADFVPIKYKITVTQGANGTVSPGTYSGFSPGTNQTYGITPNAGYQVTSVVVDGVPLAPATSYTFTNIQADHRITATFGPLP